MKKRQQSQLRELMSTVVEGGYCIGCGACTLGRSDGPIRIELDHHGCYHARATDAWLLSDDCDQVLAVCPFSGESINEDEIASALFAPAAAKDSRIGYYLACYAGHVAEGEFRQRGSSGGMASWLLCELLRTGTVDAVAHVRPVTGDGASPLLFSFAVSYTAEEVARGAKSHYYPVEMSRVLEYVREHPGRYAFVGVPCFIKALRLLARADAIFRERIVICVGLFCGHLKSTAFAQFLGWQCGVPPEKLAGIDFRKKLPERPASAYGVEVWDADGRCHSAVVGDLYGTDWGLGFFKYKACDYCDDVVGETADVSIGDAWLPQYVQDSRGTNIVVVRSKAIHDIVKDGMGRGALAFHRVSANTAADSQAGGFRHRRDGLAIRLHMVDRQRTWRPPKRVQAAASSDGRLKSIQKWRMRLAEQSHIAFREAVRAGSFAVFCKRMDPLIRRYRKLYEPGAKQKLAQLMVCIRAAIALRTRLRAVVAFLRGCRWINGKA